MLTLRERIQYKLESIWYSIIDMFGDSGRKPLMIFAALAVLLTLRSARRNLKTLKPAVMSGYVPNNNPYNPMGTQRSSSFGQSSSFGSPPGGLSSGGSGLGGGMGMAGQQPSSPYGQQTRLGGPPQMSSGMGSPSSPMSSSPLTSGGATSTGSTSTTGMGTASLHDANGQNVYAIDSSAVAWKDYGGKSEFNGQIETVQAFDDYMAVMNVLNSPGTNKVLVVDGGSSTRAAIFDAAAAQTAQRNGWSGVILTGAVRDSNILSSMNIGVKALGTTPIKGNSNGAAQPMGGAPQQMGGAPQQMGGGGGGQKGIPLNIGGTNINPGVFIYADKVRNKMRGKTMNEIFL
mmetsp:Transcript_2326/g.3120  ORF Transcript_2326/g.3120 Transcript_2326/m.3120 type:complete len:345 (-) Transcript_2326:347-1381(-)